MMRTQHSPLLLLSVLCFAVETTAFQSVVPTKLFQANRMSTARRLDASAIPPQSAKGRGRISLLPLRMSSAVDEEVNVEAVTIESLYTCPGELLQLAMHKVCDARF